MPRNTQGTKKPPHPPKKEVAVVVGLLKMLFLCALLSDERGRAVGGVCVYKNIRHRQIIGDLFFRFS